MKNLAKACNLTAATFSIIIAGFLAKELRIISMIILLLMAGFNFWLYEENSKN